MLPSTLHLRVDEERGTNLKTMQNLDGALDKLRTLEDRVSTLRSSGNPSQGGHPGIGRVCLTRQKGFENVKSYNGDGGSEKWKEWRFGTMNWIDQESSTVARVIRVRLRSLSPNPRSP